MPFVRRDSSGKIVGHSITEQADAREDLAQDNPEFVEYLKKYPPGFLRMTPDQHAKAQTEAAALNKEENSIHLAVETFNKLFSSLETSLSLLLHSLVNQPHSEIALAIYYSPTSFDARVEIVGNTLIQFAAENEPLGQMVKIWERISERIGRSRRLRNAIAHGSVSTLIIRNKKYVRLSPPAFDVIRIGRTLGKNQIPGLTAHDITNGSSALVENARFVNEALDIIAAFREGDRSLPEKLNALWAHVKPQDNRSLSHQTPLAQ